ncbi:hypothetical protein ASO20_02245 [Mycoplasma sp. (ex Biomphalaria glabrata)]|uniref:hypothetical protein n=1 Tax=Mycoplasma sp. (ex Biomphalaria glabrata) TaxID=1749074 RepID=UPI00073ABB6C|nr:hypothetical protein [Mycoplasma sp. (ex Biomphalaria glabrata)]ALV23458.1 hypothetical protein ASO20_02245 [Mycoplasma sp. (ex Biomphalaria glabrata)]
MKLQNESYSEKNLTKSIIIDYTDAINSKKIEKHNSETFIYSMRNYKEMSENLTTIDSWVSCNKHNKNLINLKANINAINIRKNV